MEVFHDGVDEDLQPPQGVHGYGRTCGHREHPGSGLGHPGRYEAVRTVREGDEIVNLMIPSDGPQDLKAFPLQSMETIINLDTG